MILLHKVVAALLSPYFIALLCIAVGTIRRSRLLVLFSVAAIYLMSTPIFANWALSELESDSHSRGTPSEEALPAKAIVVLAGMLVTVKGPGDEPHWEWSDADRFFSGLALLRDNRAPLLIFTNGQLPWDVLEMGEGDFLKARAIELGTPEDRLAVTPPVENTAQEAKAVALMLGAGSHIHLVTSAFHMPRASRLFAAEGLVVTPHPVDFKARVRRVTPMDFLPDAEAMQRTQLAFRELLGRAYYSMQ